MKLFYSEEKIVNNRNTDKFFIDYSTEDLGNNLLTIAQLHYFGSHLKKKLNHKNKYRKEHLQQNISKYKEFVSSVKLYSLLAQGLNLKNHYYKGDENSFDKDYKIFKKELIKNLDKYYLPQFSLDKLAESYLLNDEETYRKQSSFFKLNIYERPVEIISKKDKLENLSENESYSHLYDLLLNHIERYYNGNLDWFTDMGMSEKQKEHCDQFYTAEMRIKVLTNVEAKKILKSSIVKLIETLYF